jgi:hypothetical protein
MPIIITDPVPPRIRLLNFLETHLKSFEAGKQGAAPRWLRDAVYGLHALQHGEVHPILQAKKSYDKGVAPCRAKIARMMAVGGVELLCSKGYKAGKARGKVAAIFQQGRQTVKSWQFRLAPKIDDPWMQRFRQVIAKSDHLNEEQLITKLEEARELYKSAMQNKTKTYEKKTKNKKNKA